MTTLFIHAPKTKVTEEQKKSFQKTFDSGIGDGYAIPQADAARLSIGDKVVLLCKYEKKRAEGELTKLEECGKAKNGMKRYNVHFKNRQLVFYENQNLGRTGVKVI